MTSDITTAGTATAETASDVAARLGRTLAAVGGSSVLVGALAARSSSATVRAFGRQTAGWGAIDLAIAGIATLRPPPASAKKLRKVLVINAGLDVGYIAVGAHMVWHRPRFGERITADESWANGVAIVIQGAALLILDTVHARQLTV